MKIRTIPIFLLVLWSTFLNLVMLLAGATNVVVHTFTFLAVATVLVDWLLRGKDPFFGLTFTELMRGQKKVNLREGSWDFRVLIVTRRLLVMNLLVAMVSYILVGIANLPNLNPRKARSQEIKTVPASMPGEAGKNGDKAQNEETKVN